MCAIQEYQYYKKLLEEVPVKWKDTPRATEMERGCGSEMDIQTKCHKNEKSTEMNKIYKHILVPVLQNVI